MPPAGDALSGLYFDLVSSVNPQPVKRDDVAKYVSDQSQEASPSICCKDSTGSIYYILLTSPRCAGHRMPTTPKL